MALQGYGAYCTYQTTEGLSNDAFVEPARSRKGWGETCTPTLGVRACEGAQSQGAPVGAALHVLVLDRSLSARYGKTHDGCYDLR